MKHFIRKSTVIMLLALTGCSTRAQQKEPKQEPVVLKKIDLAAMRPRCEQFVQAMTRSLQSGNFADWRKALEAEGVPAKPLAVNDAKFQLMYRNLKKTHGTLLKSSYLGELNQGICRDFLWVFSFRTAKGTPKEELFAIRCADFNGTPAIAGFGFRFFNNPRVKGTSIN